MNTLRYLKLYANEMIDMYPSLEEPILEYYQLACDEVEDGESETNEVNLAISSINELVEVNC
jgi:hypothetical protein|tara:strand:+ start:240 stop:425 length:186 start_codon:yes stop_codon:yes gene_type:complete